MKVLLVNSNRERSPWPIIPVGLCRVATALDEAGFEVRVLDLCFEDAPEQALEAVLEDFEAEAVGLSIRNIDDVDSRRRVFYAPEIRDRFVKPLRRLLPERPLVLGGSAVNVAPTDFLDFLEADFAVTGDGERAAVALFRALASGESPEGIPGVLLRGQPAGADSAERYDRIEDLDRYPASRAYRWVDVKRYASYGSRYGIQTKRGCDRTCTYCSYPQIEGRNYRCFDPKGVVDEIADAFEQGGVNRFEFVDSTFNIPRDHAMAILSELKARKLDVGLDTMGLNPYAVDEELVRLMQEAGFTETSCTPESGSPAMLRALGKQFSLEQIAEAGRVLGKVGLRCKWYFMFGAPGENEETIRETFAFIDEHVPAEDLVIMMTGVRVLPGTPLETLLRKQGAIPDETRLFEPHWIYGDLGREKLEALVEAGIARRPKCCHVSGELWNLPFLMRFLHGLFTTLGLKSTGWEILRFINRIRGLWR